MLLKWGAVYEEGMGGGGGGKYAGGGGGDTL